MDIIELIFLPAILLLGIITSYQDIKFGKIRNKYIIYSLIYTVIGYLFVILFFTFRSTPIKYSYLIDLLVNSLIALILSYCFWKTRLWSAADAKLSTTYSLLVPLSVYQNTYYNLFPSLVLLVNAFVPFFIYSFFQLVFFTNKREKRESLKKIDKIDIIKAIIFLFAVSWLFSLQSILGIKIDFLFKVVIALSVWAILQRFLKKELLFNLSLFFACLRLILDYKVVFSLFFLKIFMASSSLIILILFIQRISAAVYTKEVDISKLKEGMILADTIYREKNEKKYKTILLEDIESDPSKEYEFLIFDNYAEGLRREDIISIRKIYKQGRLKFKKIKVQQTLPFAPFIFFGVLITLIARGNLFKI